ncbi:O-antigen ligase family protein [Chamaesiphon sp. VAR_48_metabat_135_sub]|uniref:O-antigen ligase family protein n=1 Tax=Chamaesiphon sp. VAR_48_metabat_135_sub TaxID=2964699 RepID=UPI00286D20D0|nr:O-antigen ligase family protein [Chamaesiphon sp. VAR_48_metabat_135_sub]
MINPLTLIPGSAWKHPHPQLQLAWNSARIGFMIFPLIPLIGAVFIFVGLVKTWQNYGREINQHRLNWGFALLAAWLILGSLFGIQPGDALLGLGNFLPFFGFFAAYSTLIQSPAQLRQLAWIFTIPAVPIMLLGLLQLSGGGGTWQLPGVPIYIWEMSVGGNPIGRMSSVFGYANSLAAYLQMVFIFALGLFADSYEKNSSETSPGGRSPFWKSPTSWWLVSILVICGVSLVLTSSRGAWSAAIFGSLLFTIYQGWYWIVSIVAAIGTIILSAAYAPSPLKEPLRSIVPRYLWARINDDMYPNQPEALSRLSQWKFAWNLTQSRPLTGWGLQSFGPLYQKSTYIWLGYPHNLLLMLSSNVGIPATIALFSLVGWILAQSTILFLNFPMQWRSERTIFFTYLVAFAGFIVFNIADVSALELRLNTHAWLILASICGIVYRSQSTR